MTSRWKVLIIILSTKNVCKINYATTLFLYQDSPTVWHKMINKLKLLFFRHKPNREIRDEEAIMNYALDLAQEWGDNWLKPIQGRLAKAFPNISQDELDNYNAIAQDAMQFGHDLVYSMAEKHGNNLDETQWKKEYLSHYPWVNDKNLNHLFSTGNYYAWKDGAGR